MVGLAYVAAIASVVVQWSVSVLVLLVLGALLAESSPGADPTAVANYSAGKRAIELLLAAFERLGVSVGWARGVLMSEGGAAGGGRRAGGVLKRFPSRKRGVPAAPKPKGEERTVRVSLEGVSLSLSDIRIVDGKFACYRITVTPATGAPWELWRRMADMIKLKAALNKVASAEVDLPQLPHSYRRSFDASRLTRRRRSIQHFLQVALKQEALRDCDALVNFLSPEVAGATSPPPESFAGVASAASAAGVTSNDGTGGSSHIGDGCDMTPPHARLRSRGGAAVAGGGGGSRSRSGSGSVGGGDGRRADGATGERTVRARSTDPPPPKHLMKQEDEEEGEEDDGEGDGDGDGDGDGESSGSSDDDGFDGASAVGVMGQGGEFGTEATEGGVPTSPAKSPLETSPRSSGRKSIHYMKNAVMTGTRRIARHVPMSMPNTKTIQRHIPMPKGVPKIPTKYYKRSSTRRSNNDIPETDAAGRGPGGGSMTDIFSDAYTSNGGRGGLGSSGGGDKSSHGVQELNGLTWQGDQELEDSLNGKSGSGGGGDISPRRRSYLWKRPTGKPGAGSTAGVGNLLRPNSAGATATTAGQENGVSNELFDGSFFRDRREDQGMTPAATGIVGESDKGGATPAPPTSSFAAGEGGKESPGRAMMGGSVGGGGSAGTVQLMGGITDGGEDHQFRVRGASFLDDGLEVKAEPALCPLVYADLFATGSSSSSSSSADSAGHPATATNGEAGATPRRADHIAILGRCGAKIDELTATVQGAKAGEDGSGGGDGDVDPPFLVIFNFQILGDPPLSLVAAWAVYPECLGPDSSDSLRRFFGLFYRLVDIPLSPTRPSSSVARKAGVSSENILWESSSGEGGDEGGGHGGGSTHAGGEQKRGAVDKVTKNANVENGTAMPPSRDSCNSSSGRSSQEGAQGGGHSDSGSSGSAAIAAADGVLGPDDLRNQRFKLVARLLDGPETVAKALPSPGSALLGQEATSRYFRGERYLEVDVDLASSLPASQVTALCRENAASLALDVGVVLQGETAAELPESVLGVLRIEGLDLKDTARHRPLWKS
eukprot:g8218.t1